MNEEQQQPQKRRNGTPLALTVVSAGFEFFVLAEILYYYLHDGERTLHEAASEWISDALTEARERYSIRHTLNMIRDLPEK